ncbi:hypothetical protein CC80DRAFT_534860 [Byssothecium circinans]|uniref:F-box domain-containing protein n=1 Tax=Byssothecium circinans TaxID=147558 RepID=A0A6A5TZA8_9PLEO|nr:hypothetical protein CC80DRAFT_534860 [Byssothecium circinans]
MCTSVAAAFTTAMMVSFERRKRLKTTARKAKTAATKAAENKEATFRFLDLPKDIRLMIYERLQVKASHLKLHPTSDRTSTIILVVTTIPGIEILVTCKRINEEASKILQRSADQLLSSAPRVILSCNRTFSIASGYHYCLLGGVHAGYFDTCNIIASAIHLIRDPYSMNLLLEPMLSYEGNTNYQTFSLKQRSLAIQFNRHAAQYLLRASDDTRTTWHPFLRTVPPKTLIAQFILHNHDDLPAGFPSSQVPGWICGVECLAFHDLYDERYFVEVSCVETKKEKSNEGEREDVGLEDVIQQALGWYTDEEQRRKVRIVEPITREAWKEEWTVGERAHYKLH